MNFTLIKNRNLEKTVRACKPIMVAYSTLRNETKRNKTKPLRNETKRDFKRSSTLMILIIFGSLIILCNMLIHVIVWPAIRKKIPNFVMLPKLHELISFFYCNLSDTDHFSRLEFF